MSAAVSTLDRPAIQRFVVEQISNAGVEASLVTDAATLTSLGLDSLDVVELSQAVKKLLGVPVAPKDFLQAATVGEAVGVICAKAGLA